MDIHFFNTDSIPENLKHIKEVNIENVILANILAGKLSEKDKQEMIISSFWLFYQGCDLAKKEGSEEKAYDYIARKFGFLCQYFREKAGYPPFVETTKTEN